MTVPTPSGAVHDVRVRVTVAGTGTTTGATTGVSTGASLAEPTEVFQLELRLREPRAPLDDSTVLARLSPLLTEPTEGNVLHIGRAHPLSPGGRSLEEVTLSLGAAAPHEGPSLEESVTEVFRDVIAHTDGQQEVTPLDHDSAIAASLRRLADVVPGLDPDTVSVTAEEHRAGRWAVRLSAPGSVVYEVHVGFVDGHPGSTHVRRTGAGEVVDSVGSE